MASARIYKWIKNSMQSGKAQRGEWIVEFEPTEPKRADPLMGWAGSSDTNGQIRLSFPTVEAAIAYAKRQALDFHVVPNTESKLKLQAYADNFIKGPLT